MRSLDEISHTNPEKPLILVIDGKEYYRYPIHTRLVKVGDNLSQLVEEYVSPYFEEGDCVYISEKIVSLCQGDIIPKEDVKLSWTAKFLSKFASTNDSAGIGVHNVYKMQVAILLCGKPKVIFAAIAAGPGWPGSLASGACSMRSPAPRWRAWMASTPPILRTTKTSASSPPKTRTRPPQGWRRRQASTAASPISTTLAGRCWRCRQSPPWTRRCCKSS